MRSIYLILVLISLLGVVTEAKATRNYSILVGAHEVRFNTSSAIESSKITYSPVMPGEDDYTHSRTTLWRDKPLLTITVRDFKSSIPAGTYFLERNTLEELGGYLPLNNRISAHAFGNPIVNGGWVDGIVYDHENKYFGALMAWPSDQIEIIITGSLPSIEMWRDISRSIELVR